MNPKIESILDRLTGKTTAQPNAIIKLNRAMVLTVGGNRRHCEIGEELTVPESELKYLEPGDFERLDKKPAAEVVDPSPARPDTRPIPETWSALPRCFSDWWNLSERFRVAREHVGMIVKTRERVLGMSTPIGEATGTAIVMSPTFGADERTDKNIYLQSRTLDLGDPVNRKLDRYLTAAESAATDHLTELRNGFSNRLRRHWLECGFAALNICEDLAAEVAELHEFALSIFAQRVAALELAPEKIQSLFLGSGVYQKYVAACPGAITPRASFAGGPESARYADGEVPQLAGHHLAALERREIVAGLLRGAKGELTKATKITKAAA